MDPDLVSRFLDLLPNLAVVAIFVALLAGFLTWVLGRAMGSESMKTASAVNAVVTGTALRRDRRQTLARILEISRESLVADGGTLLLAPAHGRLELVSAVGVRRLDLLANVSSEDEVVVKAGQQVLLASVTGLPWAALSDGRPATLAVIALHGGRASGVLVLCWGSRRPAAAASNALRQIGAYTDQVLGEFDALAEQARSIGLINETLATQVMLVRASAHDMRNKLSAARGFFGLLRGTALDASLQTMGEGVERELLLLYQMLDDFTTPDRPLEPQEVAVDDIVRVAAAMGNDGVSDGDGVFLLDAPAGLPSVWGERLGILRVLDNLIRNATRHNNRVRRLEITLTVRAVGDYVQFSVSDTGVGISAEGQARLFGFGVRLNSGKASHGIGLWSCRRVVEAHGGRIWVESAPGRGATFAFTIPIVTEARVRQAKSAAAPEPRPVPVPPAPDWPAAPTPLPVSLPLLAPEPALAPAWPTLQLRTAEDWVRDDDEALETS